MARYAAVKYPQFGRGDAPFSLQGPLPTSSDLFEDAGRLLDIGPYSNIASNWRRGFDQKHWSACKQPACLWPARNGWIMVHISTPDIWRHFCSTYLNRTIRSQVSADAIWRSIAVHELATTILSTHDVDDAAMTCQLYEIPAAVVRRIMPDEAKVKTSQIEWAVISADAMEVQQIFNREVRNGEW